MRVAVVGAGAAGTMAAIFAAEAGAETTLLERTADGGRKILISGGGRCNILPARLDESRFVTDSSPYTLRNIIRSWPLAEQIAFFERELDLTLVEETESAKLFPSTNRARDVRDGLLELARRRGARVRLGTKVTGVRQEAGSWKVEVEDGAPHVVDAVILASGGLSVPTTGSEGFGLRIARTLGHAMHDTYAALTPLTADPPPFGDLAGISLNVEVTATSADRKANARGGFLFTHRGYSGPSVLDVSHVFVRDAAAIVTARWKGIGDDDWNAALKPGPGTVSRALKEQLPERLAIRLLGLAGVDQATTLSQLRREDRTALLKVLTRCDLRVTGHESYKKAEVTGGGVNLAEIDPKTMESKKHPGLFLCGEMLDAFGPIGGYNFLWSWVTGRLAGTAAARPARAP